MKFWRLLFASPSDIRGNITFLRGSLAFVYFRRWSNPVVIERRCFCVRSQSHPGVYGPVGPAAPRGSGGDGRTGSRHRHRLWRWNARFCEPRVNDATSWHQNVCVCVCVCVCSASARGRVGGVEAPPPQTWHHQCAGSGGALGHIPQRPAGESALRHKNPINWI